jgi:hypothetical protein
LQVFRQRRRITLIDLAAQGGQTDVRDDVSVVERLFPFIALSMGQPVLCQDKQNMDFKIKIG